jgi:predicted transcriptional regulator
MAQNPPRVTDAEWPVLQLLWEQGPASIRQITEVLYPKGGPSEYATVHKFLERLEAKGFVARERSGGVYLFRAVLDRNAVIGQQLETLVEKMCGGSLTALLSNLIRTKALTADELRELRALVDNLDAQPKPKKPRG